MKDKKEILRLVSKALDYQFDSGYSWCDMIDDIQDLTPEEKEFAKQNISYKAYIEE